MSGVRRAVFERFPSHIYMVSYESPMAHVLGTNNLDSSEPYKSEHVEEMDMKGIYFYDILYSTVIVVVILIEILSRCFDRSEIRPTW